MQMVIMAAGHGTRMSPLTPDVPKPLLPFGGKSLLARIINMGEAVGIDDFIIVAPTLPSGQEIYLEAARAISTPSNLRVVWQREGYGTGAAILAVADVLRGDAFIVAPSDGLIDQDTLYSLTLSPGHIVVADVQDRSQYGAAIEENGLWHIREKAIDGPGSVSTGWMHLTRDNCLAIRLNLQGETKLTDALGRFSILHARQWVDFTGPWDLVKNLDSPLLQSGDIRYSPKQVGNNVFEGTCIIGEGTIIGPGAYLRGPLEIGKNCRIGHGVEIKHSVIMDGTKIPHLSYVGDSVIGPNCNLGAGTMIANVRHDGKPPVVGHQKAGCIMGKGVKTGVNSNIMPGSVLPAGKLVQPGSVWNVRQTGETVMKQNGSLP